MSYSVCLSIYLSICLSVCLSIYLPVCQTIYQAVWRTATCCSITSILTAGVSKPFPSQIYSILRDLTISRVEGCQSRVQIRPFCPRRLIHVCRSCLLPRRLSWMLSRTAARARSAQGASQVEFLREGIFRCRAGVGGQGKPSGDGKPVGPDVPP